MEALFRMSGLAVLSTILAGLAASEMGLAAEPPVRLKPSAPLSADLAAFPRIAAAPDDKAAQRINQALDRRDKQVQKAVKDCRDNSDHPTEATWSRAISVAMRGPGFLSLVAGDYWSCGGSHDDYSSLVLVYDLRTGSPVNWARLLPASIVQGTSMDNAGDGTPIGVVSSRMLRDLYVKEENSDPKNPLDAECKEVLNDPGLKFNIWPDAKGDGLAVQTEGLPHVVAACGAEPVVIPTAALRKLGVQGPLLDAIDTAHARGWYGPAK